MDLKINAKTFPFGKLTIFYYRKREESHPLGNYCTNTSILTFKQMTPRYANETNLVVLDQPTSMVGPSYIHIHFLNPQGPKTAHVKPSHTQQHANWDAHLRSWPFITKATYSSSVLQYSEKWMVKMAKKGGQESQFIPHPDLKVDQANKVHSYFRVRPSFLMNGLDLQHVCHIGQCGQLSHLRFSF